MPRAIGIGAVPEDASTALIAYLRILGSPFLIEALGVALYGGAAWLGLRRWLPALALGWAAHVVWDLALHLAGPGGAFTPPWYPWLCLGFDLPIAGAVMAQGRRLR